jgi:hypothetical protein
MPWRNTFLFDTARLVDENQFQVSFSRKKSGDSPVMEVKQLATLSRRISMAQRKTIQKV